jgi:hypothetical protein
MSEMRLASLGLAARHRPGYSWRSSEPTASPTASRAGTTATTLGHVCGCDDCSRPREVPEEGAPEEQVEPYGERQHGQSECRVVRAWECRTILATSVGTVPTTVTSRSADFPD